jgi:hypothetical protein
VDDARNGSGDQPWKTEGSIDKVHGSVQDQIPVVSNSMSVRKDDANVSCIVRLMRLGKRAGW